MTTLDGGDTPADQQQQQQQQQHILSPTPSDNHTTNNDGAGVPIPIPVTPDSAHDTHDILPKGADPEPTPSLGVDNEHSTNNEPLPSTLEKQTNIKDDTDTADAPKATVDKDITPVPSIETPNVEASAQAEDTPSTAAPIIIDTPGEDNTPSQAQIPEPNVSEKPPAIVETPEQSTATPPVIDTGTTLGADAEDITASSEKDDATPEAVVLKPEPMFSSELEHVVPVVLDTKESALPESTTTSDKIDPVSPLAALLEGETVEKDVEDPEATPIKVVTGTVEEVDSSVVGAPEDENTLIEPHTPNAGAQESPIVESSEPVIESVPLPTESEIADEIAKDAEANASVPVVIEDNEASKLETPPTITTSSTDEVTTPSAHVIEVKDEDVSPPSEPPVLEEPPAATTFALEVPTPKEEETKPVEPEVEVNTDVESVIPPVAETIEVKPDTTEAVTASESTPNETLEDPTEHAESRPVNPELTSIDPELSPASDPEERKSKEETHGEVSQPPVDVKVEEHKSEPSAEDVPPPLPVVSEDPASVDSVNIEEEPSSDPVPPPEPPVDDTPLEEPVHDLHESTEPLVSDTEAPEKHSDEPAVEEVKIGESATPAETTTAPEERGTDAPVSDPTPVAPADAIPHIALNDEEAPAEEHIAAPSTSDVIPAKQDDTDPIKESVPALEDVDSAPGNHIINPAGPHATDPELVESVSSPDQVVGEEGGSSEPPVILPVLTAEDESTPPADDEAESPAVAQTVEEPITIHPAAIIVEAEDSTSVHPSDDLVNTQPIVSPTEEFLHPGSVVVGVEEESPIALRLADLPKEDASFPVDLTLPEVEPIPVAPVQLAVDPSSPEVDLSATGEHDPVGGTVDASPDPTPEPSSVEEVVPPTGPSAVDEELPQEPEISHADSKEEAPASVVPEVPEDSTAADVQITKLPLQVEVEPIEVPAEAPAVTDDASSLPEATVPAPDDSGAAAPASPESAAEISETTGLGGSSIPVTPLIDLTTNDVIAPSSLPSEAEETALPPTTSIEVAEPSVTVEPVALSEHAVDLPSSEVPPATVHDLVDGTDPEAEKTVEVSSTTPSHPTAEEIIPPTATSAANEELSKDSQELDASQVRPQDMPTSVTDEASEVTAVTSTPEHPVPVPVEALPIESPVETSVITETSSPSEETIPVSGGPDPLDTTAEKAGLETEGLGSSSIPVTPLTDSSTNDTIPSTVSLEATEPSPEKSATPIVTAEDVEKPLADQSQDEHHPEAPSPAEPEAPVALESSVADNDNEPELAIPTESAGEPNSTKLTSEAENAKGEPKDEEDPFADPSPAVEQQIDDAGAPETEEVDSPVLAPEAGEVKVLQGEAVPTADIHVESSAAAGTSTEDKLPEVPVETATTDVEPVSIEVVEVPTGLGPNPVADDDASAAPGSATVLATAEVLDPLQEVASDDIKPSVLEETVSKLDEPSLNSDITTSPIAPDGTEGNVAEAQSKAIDVSTKQPVEATSLPDEELLVDEPSDLIPSDQPGEVHITTVETNLIGDAAGSLDSPSAQPALAAENVDVDVAPASSVAVEALSLDQDVTEPGAKEDQPVVDALVPDHLMQTSSLDDENNAAEAAAEVEEPATVVESESSPLGEAQPSTEAEHKSVSPTTIPSGSDIPPTALIDVTAALATDAEGSPDLGADLPTPSADVPAPDEATPEKETATPPKIGDDHSTNLAVPSPDAEPAASVIPEQPSHIDERSESGDPTPQSAVETAAANESHDPILLDKPGPSAESVADSSTEKPEVVDTSEPSAQDPSPDAASETLPAPPTNPTLESQAKQELVVDPAEVPADVTPDADLELAAESGHPETGNEVGQQEQPSPDKAVATTADPIANPALEENVEHSDDQSIPSATSDSPELAAEAPKPTEPEPVNDDVVEEAKVVEQHTPSIVEESIPVSAVVSSSSEIKSSSEEARPTAPSETQPFEEPVVEAATFESELTNKLESINPTEDEPVQETTGSSDEQAAPLVAGVPPELLSANTTAFEIHADIPPTEEDSASPVVKVLKDASEETQVETHVDSAATSSDANTTQEEQVLGGIPDLIIEPGLTQPDAPSSIGDASPVVSPTLVDPASRDEPKNMSELYEGSSQEPSSAVEVESPSVPDIVAEDVQTTTEGEVPEGKTHPEVALPEVTPITQDTLPVPEKVLEAESTSEQEETSDLPHQEVPLSSARGLVAEPILGTSTSVPAEDEKTPGFVETLETPSELASQTVLEETQPGVTSLPAEEKHDLPILVTPVTLEGVVQPTPDVDLADSHVETTVDASSLVADHASTLAIPAIEEIVAPFQDTSSDWDFEGSASSQHAPTADGTSQVGDESSVADTPLTEEIPEASSKAPSEWEFDDDVPTTASISADAPSQTEEKASTLPTSGDQSEDKTSQKDETPVATLSERTLRDSSPATTVTSDDLLATPAATNRDLLDLGSLTPTSGTPAIHITGSAVHTDSSIAGSSRRSSLGITPPSDAGDDTRSEVSASSHVPLPPMSPRPTEADEYFDAVGLQAALLAKEPGTSIETPTQEVPDAISSSAEEPSSVLAALKAGTPVAWTDTPPSGSFRRESYGQSIQSHKSKEVIEPSTPQQPQIKLSEPGTTPSKAIPLSINVPEDNSSFPRVEPVEETPDGSLGVPSRGRVESSTSASSHYPQLPGGWIREAKSRPTLDEARGEFIGSPTRETAPEIVKKKHRCYIM